mgnify:CR=1 FL=1
MTDPATQLFPIVLAGPSGGGKTTVRTALLERRDDMEFSVSATTRPARRDEVDGEDYSFIRRPAFEAMIQEGDLLEWAEVHGELYGTPRENLRRACASGRHLLLDVDVQGARQLREVEPDVVTVFLLPPGFERLVDRLRSRGSEDGPRFRRRMRTALAELAEVRQFDYVVVNDDLDVTVRRVEEIISAEHHRVERAGPAVLRLVEELTEALNRIQDESAKEEAS